MKKTIAVGNDYMLSEIRGKDNHYYYVLINKAEIKRVSYLTVLEFLFKKGLIHTLMEHFNLNNIEEIEHIIDYHRRGKEEVKDYLNKFGWQDTLIRYKFYNSSKLRIFLYN